ncbi:hypothetical protein O3M35_000945 [Rhynocoris fuscipes]|uniref:Uncharacterized protein n=1 Tax=Rhynocoris fuscipes TaxID=488301 RepID=A0AAW1DTM8_9HEMI
MPPQGRSSGFHIVDILELNNQTKTGVEQAEGTSLQPNSATGMYLTITEMNQLHQLGTHPGLLFGGGQVNNPIDAIHNHWGNSITELRGEY